MDEDEKRWKKKKKLRKKYRKPRYDTLSVPLSSRIRISVKYALKQKPDPARNGVLKMIFIYGLTETTVFRFWQIHSNEQEHRLNVDWRD